MREEKTERGDEREVGAVGHGDGRLRATKGEWCEVVVFSGYTKMRCKLL